MSFGWHLEVYGLMNALRLQLKTIYLFKQNFYCICIFYFLLWSCCNILQVTDLFRSCMFPNVVCFVSICPKVLVVLFTVHTSIYKVVSSYTSIKKRHMNVMHNCTIKIRAYIKNRWRFTGLENIYSFVVAKINWLQGCLIYIMQSKLK